MITTGGHQVGVMPQYTPVNPALVALDPTNLTQGISEGIQVSSALDKLKAFRQHQEEFAKMESARNAMLQAQSDQEVIKLQHAQAIRDAEIAKELAEFKAKEKTAGPKADAEVAQANTTVETLKAQQPNIAPAAKLAGLQIGSATADVGEKETLRPETFDVKKTELKASAEKAHLDYVKALDDLASFPEDTERKKLAEQAKISADMAMANYHNALADFNKRRPDLEQAKTDSKLADRTLAVKEHEALRNRLKDDEANLTKLGDETVQVAPGQPIKVSELAATIAKDSKGNYFIPGKHFWSSNTPVPAAAVSAIKRWIDSAGEVEASRRAANQAAQAVQAHAAGVSPSSASIPPKGTRVRQGGVVYEFDGVSPTPKPVQ